MTITQENITYERVKRPALSQQVATRLQWTDQTAWQTQNINNKKGLVQKKHRLWTSGKHQRTYKAYSPRTRPLLFFAWVKLLGVIRFLHSWPWQEIIMVGMEPHKFFMPQYYCRQNITVRNGNIGKDCCLMYDKSSTTCKMDSVLIYYFLESKTLTMLSTNTSCSKKAREGSSFPDRTCYGNKQLLLNSNYHLYRIGDGQSRTMFGFINWRSCMLKPNVVRKYKKSGS